MFDTDFLSVLAFILPYITHKAYDFNFADQ